MRYFTLSLICLILTSTAYSQTSYNPDSALRSEIREQSWQSLQTQTPALQKFLLQALFMSNDIFNLYEESANKQGIPAYEFASVTTFHEVVCKEVIQGRNFSDQEIDKAYQKNLERYQTQNIDSDLNEKQSQEKYDAIILDALWLVSMQQMGGGKKTNLKTIAQEFSQKNPLHDSRQIADVSSTQKSLPPATPPKENQKQSPPNQPETQPIQRNGHQGVTDIILRTSTNYGLGGVYIENDVHVLYENGDIFTNPSAPLSQLNIPKSKQTKPKKWNRWKKQGSSLWITKHKTGKTYEWKKWFQLRNADVRKSLSGKFKTSDPFGGAAVINASIVAFDKQGRFAWKTIKGGNTSWKPMYSESRTAGTYRLENYTMHLKYNNGKEESFFFGYYPKDVEHFVIGSRHFVPLDD